MKNGSAGLLILALHHFVAGIFARVYFMLLYRFTTKWTFFSGYEPGQVNTPNVIFMFTRLSVCQTRGCTKKIFFDEGISPTICPQHRFFAALTPVLS